MSLISIAFILISTRKRTITTTGNIVITSSLPADGEIGVSVFNPIELTFNQEVDPLLVEVFSDPSETWSLNQKTNNSFELNHKSYLRVATKYQMTIKYNGDNIGSLSFVTAKEQNDPRLLQTLQSEMDRDYPLAKLTPYETPELSVVYSAPLTLEIDIKGQISTAEAILKIQSWVKQKGTDPSTHKYTIKE